jgi:hypothetical protein
MEFKINRSPDASKLFYIKNELMRHNLSYLIKIKLCDNVYD